MFMRRKEKKFWWTQRSDYYTELHLQTSHICSAESGEQRTHDCLYFTQSSRCDGVYLQAINIV